MKAVVYYGPGEAAVEEVQRPIPGEDEVLIEVSRVQLSVTECMVYQDEELAFTDSVAERLTDDGIRTFGHEFCGTVVEAGPDVETFAVGDRVYAPGKISCGDCPHCRAGFSSLCTRKQTIGLHRPGALGEYLTLPTEPLCKLDPAVSDAEGAAMQPLASSVVCVQDADIRMGDVVVILGTGVMGYQCGQLALQQGASTVVAVDIDPIQLEFAADRGMETVNPTESDPVDQIEALTDGVGADVVFEAVGGDQSHATDGADPLAQAFQIARPGGRIVQVGLITGDLQLSPGKMRSKSVQWINPTMGRTATGPNGDSGELAVELVASGRVSIEELVSHELQGLESFETAIDITANKQAHGARGPAQIVF